MIVSVSRRCDIPRFKFDWFIERLNEGFVDVTNPYNSKQIKRVSLVKENVDAFVFWTRDPNRILANADELTKRGYPFYVMVSLTGYPNVLEPNQAVVSEVLKSMKELAQKIGKERVIWRYDPVILTDITNDEFHWRKFNELAQELASSVQRVIISVYDEYKRAAKRLGELEKKGRLKLLNMDSDNLRGVLLGLNEIARANNMEIQSCAEKEDFSSIGIKSGACIDAALIEKICGAPFNCAQAARDKNQRPNCLCCQSVDIGAYNTCAAHCVYCYAS